MAKLALKNREAKRAKMVAKYAAKRAELLAIINNAKLSDEERMAARLKYQQLPRDASPVRLRMKYHSATQNRTAAISRPVGIRRVPRLKAHSRSSSCSRRPSSTIVTRRPSPPYGQIISGLL